MSGGSYNYLCLKTISELLGAEDDIERMVDRLAGLGYAIDVAQETMTFLLELRAASLRLTTMSERLYPIWLAIEWWDSGDFDEGQVKEAIEEYRGKGEKNAE